MERTLEELELRASFLSSVLVPKELREECIRIARKKSPSAAKSLAKTAALQALLETHLLERVGKATRWLSIIRRDYGKEAFEEAVTRLQDQAQFFAQRLRRVMDAPNYAELVMRSESEGFTPELDRAFIEAVNKWLRELKEEDPTLRIPGLEDQSLAQFFLWLYENRFIESYLFSGLREWYYKVRVAFYREKGY